MNLSAFSFVLYPSALEPSMNSNTSKRAYWGANVVQDGNKTNLIRVRGWEEDFPSSSNLFSQSLALQISKCIRAEFCPYYSLHKVKWNGEVVKIIIVKKFVLYVF